MPADETTDDRMDVVDAAGAAPAPAKTARARVPAALKAFAKAAPTRDARAQFLAVVRSELAASSATPPSAALLLRRLFEAVGPTGLAAASATPFLAQLGAHASATRPVLLVAGAHVWQLCTAPGAQPAQPCGDACLYWSAAWTACAPELCAPTRSAALPLALVQLAPLLGRATGRPLLAPPRVAAGAAPLQAGVAALAGPLLHEPRLLPSTLAPLAPRAQQDAHAHTQFWSLDHRGSALLVYPPPDPATTDPAGGYAYYSDAATPFAWQRVDPALGQHQLAAWAPPDAPAAARELVPCTSARARALRAACARAAPPVRIALHAARLAFVRALERAAAGLAGFPAYVPPDVPPLPGPVDWGATGPGTTAAAALQQFLVRVLLPDEPFWLAPNREPEPDEPPRYDWLLTTCGVYYRALAPGEDYAPTQADLPNLDAARWRFYDGHAGRIARRATRELAPPHRPEAREEPLLTRRALFAHVHELVWPATARAPAVLRAAGVVHGAVRAALAQLAACLWPDCAAVLAPALAGPDGRDALALAGQLAAVPAAWWRTLAGPPDPAQPLAGVPPAVLLAFLTVVRERHVLAVRGGDAGWTWGWADSPTGVFADAPMPDDSDESDESGDDTDAHDEGQLPRTLASLAALWPRPAWADARLALLAGRGSLGPRLVRIDLRAAGSGTLRALWQWAWAAREWQPLSERAVAWWLAADRTLAALVVPARLAAVLAAATRPRRAGGSTRR